MESSEQLAGICQVLSVPTRVRIIQLLKGRALCVGALAGRLDVTQGAVSQHLRILRDAGLVQSERRGYFIHYRTNDEMLATYQAQLRKLLGGVAEKLQEETGGCANERKQRCVKKKANVRSQKT